MRTTKETERYEQLRDNKTNGMSSTAKDVHKLHLRIPHHKGVLAEVRVSALQWRSSFVADAPNNKEESEQGIYLATKENL